MTFARTGGQFLRDTIALTLSQVFHTHALWDVLKNQPIRIIVGATLPGIIRNSEVESRVSGRFGLGVPMKLGTIICRDFFAHACSRCKGSMHLLLSDRGVRLQRPHDQLSSSDNCNPSRGDYYGPTLWKWCCGDAPSVELLQYAVGRRLGPRR